jgi:hypothetical protein
MSGRWLARRHVGTIVFLWVIWVLAVFLVASGSHETPAGTRTSSQRYLPQIQGVTPWAASRRSGEDGGRLANLDGLRVMVADRERLNTGVTRKDLDSLRGLRSDIRAFFVAM